MFGCLQLRKWDPGIFLLHKLCCKEFSLKGVQCKQWDLGIACLRENLHAGLMERDNLFFAHEFKLKFSYMVDKCTAL